MTETEYEIRNEAGKLFCMKRVNENGEMELFTNNCTIKGATFMQKIATPIVVVKNERNKKTARRH